MRTTIKAGLAAAAVVGLIALGAPLTASADETATTEEVTSSTSTPTTDAPSTSPAEAPGSDGSAGLTTPATEPSSSPEATPTPSTITPSTDTSTSSTTPPVTPPTRTVEIVWGMPNGGTPDHVTWPQTYSPDGTTAPGTCSQIDTYLATEAPRFYADGKLEQGEDYESKTQRGAISWRFVCVPPVVVTPTGPVTITAPTLVPTSPTCDADGSLPFLGNPAAQNPNGYEFPGQGFRVYIAPAFTGPGTYVATIQKVGPGFDPAFPKGTKVVGATSQTLTVLPKTGTQSTDASAPCYVTPPVEPPVVVPPVTVPEAPVTPAVTPVVETAPVIAEKVATVTPDALAYTGTGQLRVLLFVMIGLLLVGSGVVAVVAPIMRKPNPRYRRTMVD